MAVEKIPEKNSVLFVWLNNYAGVLLKTPTKTLLIDPVEVKARSFPHVDAVLITHEHYDHFDQRLIIALQKNTDCTVIADTTSAKSLKTYLPKGKLLETVEGDENMIGEVRIKTQKCKHPAGTPVTYTITTEDGVRIWHTADSLPYPEMAQIGLKEKIDIAFCTVGIAPGASPETGSEIAWLTKPKVAVPYHTNTANSQKRFFDIIRKELSKTVCVLPEVNKIYQVSIGERKNE